MTSSTPLPILQAGGAVLLAARLSRPRPEGWQLSGRTGRARAQSSVQARPQSAVPLAPVTRGLSWSLADNPAAQVRPHNSVDRADSQANSPTSEPDPGRVGHTWDAAQPLVRATSLAAGHRPETNLSRGAVNRLIHVAGSRTWMRCLSDATRSSRMTGAVASGVDRSWTGPADNPRAVNAISAITRVICAASARVA
jgi:hypothetical protein